MTSYRIVWEIEIEADSPEAAAKIALEIQRDVNSTALVFDVEEDVRGSWPVRIDLALPSEEE